MARWTLSNPVLGGKYSTRTFRSSDSSQIQSASFAPQRFAQNDAKSILSSSSSRYPPLDNMVSSEVVNDSIQLYLVSMPSPLSIQVKEFVFRGIGDSFKGKRSHNTKMLQKKAAGSSIQTTSSSFSTSAGGKTQNGKTCTTTEGSELATLQGLESPWHTVKGSKKLIISTREDIEQEADHIFLSIRFARSSLHNQ